MRKISFFSTALALALSLPVSAFAAITPVVQGGTGVSSFTKGWIYSPGGTVDLTSSSSPTVGWLTATSLTVPTVLKNVKTQDVTINGQLTYGSATGLLGLNGGQAGALTLGPGLSFSWPTLSNTGILSASCAPPLVCSGTDPASFSLASPFQVNGSILVRGGAPGGYAINNNGYAFSGNGGDNDSGLFSLADGQVALYANGGSILEVTNAVTSIANTLTIGGANPDRLLNVNGGITARGGAPGPYGNNNNGYAFNGSGDGDSGMYSSADGQIEFYSNGDEQVRIDHQGVKIISGDTLCIGSTCLTEAQLQALIAQLEE